MRAILTFALMVSGAAGARLDCRPCHRAIYESYRRTAMANSSGRLQGTLPSGEFRHNASGFRYRVADNAVGFDNGSLRGSKTLAYFVGSGAAARSYLVDEGGFLFLAPVAHYTRESKWELSPGYSGYSYPYTTRPILPGCLTCHASFLKPVEGTQNRYGTPPFEEGGVACERCHGDVGAHDALVNPAKLAPDRRDSICAQCHLSGEARVQRAGTDWRTYRPGDRLSDSVEAFVRAGGAPGMTVTGHVEKLAQSACKRASGDKLWCGTCHDPHTGSATCGGCHTGQECRRGPDCAGCHMPKTTVTDAQHVVYTDHSIPRRPRPPSPTPRRGELVLFGGGSPSARDLGLAYAIAGDRARALPLLEKAPPDDREAVVYLAEIHRDAGRRDRAGALYRRALRLAPDDVGALVGLGAIVFERGDSSEAVRLWKDAEARNPGLVLARTNLAMAQWRNGDRDGARATLKNVIELSPAFRPAVELLERLK